MQPQVKKAAKHSTKDSKRKLAVHQNQQHYVGMCNSKKLSFSQNMLLSFNSAHTAFKDCLMEETKSCSCQGDTCQDGGNLGQEATTFARIIVDNAIGFLLNRCSKSK